MTLHPNRLLEVAEQISEGKQPEAETVRAFIGWFGVRGRGRNKVQEIREALAELDLATQPDFDAVNIDSPIHFVRASDQETPSERIIGDKITQLTETRENASVVLSTTFVSGIVADPTHRVSRLASAGKVPVSVTPDSTLQEAVYLMTLHGLAQLPVMQGDRVVKGVVSWNFIGFRKLAGYTSNVVRDYMEKPQEIAADASLFDAIPLIVKHRYVLVRDAQNRISGMVTTSDLSELFRQLSEPFLLLGEVENHIRSLIVGKFTGEELAAIRDPSDEEREVGRVDELTFGEYKRLLEKPEHWDKVDLLAIDRKSFCKQLDEVRLIRNRVMHFEPDGLEEDELEALRRFAELLRQIQEVNSA